VDKVVYKNVRVNNAVMPVNHDPFIRGKAADVQRKGLSVIRKRKAT